MTQACRVTDCVSLGIGRSGRCVIHQFARLAKELSHDGKVLSALRCLTCKRSLKATDWIYDEPGSAPRHVRCEPNIQRVKKKTEPKPLLEIA